MRRDAAARPRKPDRAATENALRAAALRLLKRDGVLVGINMQEVADEAGVNRGLIHHYFGSRRSLLRSALDLGIKRSVPEALRRRVLDPEEKGTRQFRDYVRDHAEYPRLVALLALDGDETLEPLLFADDRLEDYERERGAGQFADDVDFAALLTTWDATLIGYSLIREAASRQLGIPPRRLDRRILAMLARQMQALRPKND